LIPYDTAAPLLLVELGLDPVPVVVPLRVLGVDVVSQVYCPWITLLLPCSFAKAAHENWAVLWRLKAPLTLVRAGNSTLDVPN
jgi:hypothetical protein